MKKIVYLLLLTLLTSCITNTLTSPPLLRYQYPDTTQWVQVQKSYDSVFDDIIDYMVEQGYSLEKIDRTNGIIQIYAHIWSDLVTYETKDGVKNPDAYAVTTMANFYVKSSIVFRVKPLTSTTATVGVRVIPYTESEGIKDFYRTKTTGVYEKRILEQLAK